MAEPLDRFWSMTAQETLTLLGIGKKGLTGEEASDRLRRYGRNVLMKKKKSSPYIIVVGQLKNPITLLLLFAAVLSLFLGDVIDAVLIFVIVIVSDMLWLWQEHRANKAIEKLLELVTLKANVMRDGREAEIPFEDIVPGDIVVLNAGDGIPGDSLIIESKDLFVDEAALTGESYPAEKAPAVVPDDAPIRNRSNSLFMGTHVVSGTALSVVVKTGMHTELGKVSRRLEMKRPTPQFEAGITKFGLLLVEVTGLLVFAIFAINVYLHRPVLESFLFALALAVGLTPQLLPAIISVNLAEGAKRMANKKVIVKRLTAIENFGSMEVLCADKTGTLTEGKVQVHSGVSVDGNQSEKTLLYAYINAYFECGFTSPIDEAIRSYRQFDMGVYTKADEIPYDFIRKRLSILVLKDSVGLMVTKGSLMHVLDICTKVEMPDGTITEMDGHREAIEALYQKLSGMGLRTLGVAYKTLPVSSLISKDEERDMTFLGILALYDPPKPGIGGTIKRLNDMGVSFKVITGDSSLVASHIANEVGMENVSVVTGDDLRWISDDALKTVSIAANVFAEVEPNQKERLILAMKKAGYIVGYIGDGINDGPALHSADVGISVDSAVDVAKESAEIVLMEKDLGVLVNGVEEGRTTFANTLKYVFMATSANFGNMFSMAAASLFLPFLPLLPTQILLTNLLTDLPEMTIATDNVDRELVERPGRWDLSFIKKFMLAFGLLSSLFDFATFGVLYFVLHAAVGEFRTGWFMESVISAAMIVLVLRTRRPFFKSRPGKYLTMATLLVVFTVIALPYTPLAGLFKFQPLPPFFIAVLAVIVVLYVIGAEIMKKAFYRFMTMKTGKLL